MAEGRGRVCHLRWALREALSAGSEGLSPAHLLVLAKGTAKYRGLGQGVLGRFKGQQEQQSGRMEREQTGAWNETRFTQAELFRLH